MLLPERADGLRTRFPEEADSLIARAETFAERRFTFFGYPEVVVPEQSVDVDPFSGRPWPTTHGKRIDYRRADPGDPKWIWELNRCQHLPVLVAAWLVSGDERYAAVACAGMRSWIERHPPGRGIAWANGFEAGVRAISLALAFDGLRSAPSLSSEVHDLALQSLWQHGVWIERDPSIGSSANNHRVGELVGLIVIGSLAPELRAASGWIDEGLRGLCREVELQLRNDGTSAEQAFSYHLFVLDLLLVATAALDVAGRAVPVALVDAFERSGRALWAQVGENEPSPTYGDADDGRALLLSGEALRDARGIASAIAARFGDSRAAAVAARLDATAWWLFGETGEERFARVAPEPPPRSLTLPDGGLTILRAGRCRTVFDHGPHGYLAIAAHAHADALRIDVARGKAELIVDPGVGSYFGRPSMREAFRGTGFHATVTVDGTDSSSAGGPFLWTRHAQSRLLFADPDVRVAIAEHDGYSRLDDPVSHRRAVATIDEDAIVVLDRLEGHGIHRYAQRWPLHPALEIHGWSDDAVVASTAEYGIRLAFAASHAAVVRAVRGQEDPPEGWWSERLESVVPSWLVSVEFEAAGRVYVAALLTPFGRRAPDSQVELEVDDDLARVSVTRASRLHTVDVAFARPRITVSAQSGTRVR